MLTGRRLKIENSQREAERGNMEEKEIGGRYVCKKTLGKGGNGSVFLCWDLKLQKEWAVKELPILDGESTELDLLKTISCNLFPRIVDVVYEQDKGYLIMDYVEGVTLKEKMQRQKLTEKEVLPWAVEIAKALCYLHQMSPQILYMDCKPENIMLTPQGEIRLVDLGSVYTCHSKKKQRISGTRFFAPKEQQGGNGTKQKNVGGEPRNGGKEDLNPDVRSDIYAYGMTLYYLLVGKKKVYRRLGRLSIRDANPAVSEGMSAVIARCTQTDPGKRPQSMDEVLYMLTNIKQISEQERIKTILGKALALLGKCACVGIILICAWLYAGWKQKSAMLGFLTAMLVFLLLCMRRRFTIYEVKKEVFCGSGKRVLLVILICTNVLIGIQATSFNVSAKREMDELSITIYDEKWRKLLIKNGFSWGVQHDIFLSIPVEEIGTESGRITVIYTDLESKDEKVYSFFCHRK